MVSSVTSSPTFAKGKVIKIIRQIDSLAFVLGLSWSVLVAYEGNVVVAHNTKFDVEMLGRERFCSQKALCALKLTRYLNFQVPALCD